MEAKRLATEALLIVAILVLAFLAVETTNSVPLAVGVFVVGYGGLIARKATDRSVVRAGARAAGRWSGKRRKKRERKNSPSQNTTSTTEPESPQKSTTEIPQEQAYQLRKRAQKSVPVTMLLSLIAPLGYLIVGRKWWALLAFLTGNFFILGGLIIPFHTRKIILDARAELRAAGISY